MPLLPLSSLPFPKLERRWRNATSHSDAGSDEEWEDGDRLTCGSMPEPKAPVAREYRECSDYWEQQDILDFHVEKEVYKVL